MAAMNRRLALVALLALTALLAACAPTVVGSRSTPFDLARQRTAAATPGATIYGRLSYTLADFRLPADAFRDRVAIPLGANGRAVRVTREFDLIDAIAPQGWALAIEDVWAESFGAAPPSIVVTYRLEVPRDARLGGERIRASLRAISTNATRPLDWVVQVTPR
jgi:hypothetical protein